VAANAEHRFTRLRGHTLIVMARDAYSYLHLPMIAGIILVALGIKKTLEAVDEPLKTVPAAALLGGVALYYVAGVAFRLRVTGSFNPQRVAAAVLCLAMIPVATEVDALLALAFAAVIAAAVIAYEALRAEEERMAIAHSAGEETARG
jgi:low temperature requirement protein LtrA